MTSYNKVNGTYANENAHLLKEILRGEWGYEGAVVTDWGGSNDYTEGVRAGMDLEMPGSGDDSAIQLMKAVREGRIEESLVDRRVDELLTLIDITTATRGTVKADLDADHQVAEKAAESAVVLLKNESALLPLAMDAKVAFIGGFVDEPRYQGAGSSMVNAYKVDKTSELLKAAFPQCVGTAKGFERLDKENEALAAEAEALAKTADIIVLYIGLTESFETEGLDRTHMRLPGNQVALLQRLSRLGKPIVAVLSAGSAVEMPWLDKCQALVYGGLGGQAGAGAMLRVLSGEVCPSGKLAETFPIAYEDVPSSHYYPGDELTSEYREGLFVGYRAFETMVKAVRFPFGFGLSYTTFAYADLKVDEQGVSFAVTNTGKVAGAEAAQLYVALPGAKVFRPAKELKGFAKVALQPGETKQVTIPFDDKTFRYFDVVTGRFETETGTYQIMIGASVQDIRLTGSLAVKGTRSADPYAGKAIDCYRACSLDAVPDAQFAALLGHAVPQHLWDRKAPLGMNDTVSQLEYARNPIARFAWKILRNKKDKSIEMGKPDLNMLFIFNIPFRGMAKMMGGMVSMRMAEAILFMCNGHGFRGLGRLIAGFFSRPSLSKIKEDK